VIRPFVQGDLANRRKHLRFPALLAAGHIAMAGLVVALVYQAGTPLAGYLPRQVALAICVAASVAAIAVDVRAVRRHTYSIGLHRQTAKALAHAPNRRWWVTALLWGLDTGLIWSTFRVSAASWVLLLAALLNVVPQWGGLVYGACFGVPLLVAVSIGDPDRFDRPDGWPLRLVQLTGVALMAALPLGTVLGLAGAG
jgi:hypothetical protein